MWDLWLDNEILSQVVTKIRMNKVRGGGVIGRSFNLAEYFYKIIYLTRNI
jgi:hypothetical protein